MTNIVNGVGALAQEDDGRRGHKMEAGVDFFDTPPPSTPLQPWHMNLGIYNIPVVK